MSWINKNRQGLLMLTGEIELDRITIRLIPIGSTDQESEE